MSRRKVVWQDTKAGITVVQEQNKAGLFRVIYGLDISDKLTYLQACASIGQALLHHLSCEGIVNNEGK